MADARYDPDTRFPEQGAGAGNQQSSDPRIAQIQGVSTYCHLFLTPGASSLDRRL